MDEAKNGGVRGGETEKGWSGLEDVSRAPPFPIPHSPFPIPRLSCVMCHLPAACTRPGLKNTGAKTTLFNLRLGFAAEQAYGLLPIAPAYGLGVLSAVFRGLQLEISGNLRVSSERHTKKCAKAMPPVQTRALHTHEVFVVYMQPFGNLEPPLQCCLWAGDSLRFTYAHTQTCVLLLRAKVTHDQPGAVVATQRASAHLRCPV